MYLFSSQYGWTNVYLALSNSQSLNNCNKESQNIEKLKQHFTLQTTTA